MADNETLTSGGIVAMDEVSINGITVKVGRNKLGFGADGTYTEVSSVNPFPVTGPLTDAQLRATALPVSGTFWPATQPVSGTVGVSGSVAVTGTFWQATQPISAASLPLPSGAATAALQTTGNGSLATIASSVAGGEYERVAASQTTQALGATGAVGDKLVGLLVIPASTSPGAVSIKDGSNAAMVVFEGGASSVGSKIPFFLPIDAVSVNGAWQVTTGADVSVLATGNFT